MAESLHTSILASSKPRTAIRRLPAVPDLNRDLNRLLSIRSAQIYSVLSIDLGHFKLKGFNCVQKTDELKAKVGQRILNPRRAFQGKWSLLLCQNEQASQTFIQYLCRQPLNTPLIAPGLFIPRLIMSSTESDHLQRIMFSTIRFTCGLSIIFPFDCIKMNHK